MCVCLGFFSPFHTSSAKYSSEGTHSATTSVVVALLLAVKSSPRFGSVVGWSYARKALVVNERRETGSEENPAVVQRNYSCCVLWGREPHQELSSHRDVRENDKSEMRNEFSSRRN